ncbi:hypothetical protein [Paenibacillus sp. VMFN-D1]|uniref:hypothetical protein n=1 Tax=Paenibacillus sp. VMFN-D1 TaxID=2135608 RepID=UPI000E22570B|nr:hypothetical protein [Paenibacillus sp. VMFN-D1]RED37056.1 hypothetical protein C7820_3846 [Paenibacillus sp. VMFN-D1]
MNTTAIDLEKGDISHKKLMVVFFIFFLFYITIYGTMSIFMANISLRSVKDLVLLIMVFYGFIYSFNHKLLSHLLIFIYGSLYLISLTSILVSHDLLSFIYGVKISLLPMGMIFFGPIIASHFNIKKHLVVIYLLLVTVWLIQYYLGIDRLMEMGFVYGVNIKHFSGQLRLPSTVGAPDNYAMYIALISAAINTKLRGKLRALFLILSTVLVILSTLRTAILFWLVYILVTVILKLVKSSTKMRSFITSIVCFMVSFGIMLLPVFTNTSYASSKSFIDRLTHWFDFVQPLNSVEGIIGRGMGIVGAASRRISDLNINSLDYPVDNQYIALFEQIGLMGICFVFFFMVVSAYLLYKKGSDEGLAILLATSFSCLVTNTLELYPFNVLFWALIGMCIVNPSILKSKTTITK